jgi:hypothetical protein
MFLAHNLINKFLYGMNDVPDVDILVGRNMQEM